MIKFILISLLFLIEKKCDPLNTEKLGDDIRKGLESVGKVDPLKFDRFWERIQELESEKEAHTIIMDKIRRLNDKTLKQTYIDLSKVELSVEYQGDLRASELIITIDDDEITRHINGMNFNFDKDTHPLNSYWGLGYGLKRKILRIRAQKIPGNERSRFEIRLVIRSGESKESIKSFSKTGDDGNTFDFSWNIEAGKIRSEVVEKSNNLIDEVLASSKK